MEMLDQMREQFKKQLVDVGFISADDCDPLRDDEGVERGGGGAAAAGSNAPRNQRIQRVQRSN